jgi:hypothetical protein
VSEARWSFEIPNGWYRLPAADAESDQRLDALVSSFVLPDDTAARLRVALGNLNAEATRRPNRAHWAFVPDPANGNVEGMFTVHMLRAEPGDREAYIAAAEEPAASTLIVMHRTVEHLALPAGPALSLHDFVVEPPVGGIPNPGVERAVVAVFPEDSSFGYEFSMIAQNLTAFQDMVEYVVAVARTVYRVDEAA